MLNEKKIEQLAFMLQAACDQHYTGELVVKFYKGGITKVTKETCTEVEFRT